jgi:perosamine synthetase
MQKKIKIPLSEPFFFGNEKKELIKCLEKKWISASGFQVKIFENKIKKLIKAKHVLGIINGTASLQLAIKILKPKENDEILVPSITFIATVNSILYNNCKPVFIDCDRSLLIDIKKVKNFIEQETYYRNGNSYNKKTKKRVLSIIVVHVFGNLVNLNKEFVKFCNSRNINIIEDAAESLGSKYLNSKKQPSTVGDIGCLSFNGNKILTSGGGGMLVFKKKDHYNYGKYLSNQSKNDTINFIHNEVGYNFRLSNLHAAIGNAQLKYFKKILQKKRSIHNFYSNEIDRMKGIKILKESKYCKSNYWLNVIEINKNYFKINKDKLIKKFLQNKIEVRSLWYPNHLQKHLKKYQKYKVDNSERMFNSCICLPSSYSLTNEQQNKVIEILKKYSF